METGCFDILQMRRKEQKKYRIGNFAHRQRNMCNVYAK